MRKIYFLTIVSLFALMTVAQNSATNVLASGNGGNELSTAPDSKSFIQNKPSVPNMNLVLNQSGNTLEVQIEENKNAFFEIYNVLGNKVKSLILSDVKTRIDLSDIPEGMYLVVMKEENYTITKKINVTR